MPSTTLWPKDEQTAGKHLVLKSYLDGWFPILGRRNGRLVFIDGFAGPGEYESGELGSPLIALDCVKQHKQKGRLRGVEVVLLFIEADEARASHLTHRLEKETLPKDVSFLVLRERFDDHMENLLNYMEEQKRALAPAFVMIDPFGIKGSRMHLIDRTLQNDKSECMISFMYEPIRRFHQQREFGEPLDDLFGTTDWRNCLDIVEVEEKKRFLHDLFKAQLKKHGAEQVVFFELLRGNRHVNTIFFASGSLKGCDLMKQAIWKADRSGGYRVKAHAGAQGLLLEPTTDPLAAQLQGRFGNELVPVEDVEAFVMSDETRFHTGQLRRDTLQPLERRGRIAVFRPPAVRGGFASGKGIRIRFL